MSVPDTVAVLFARRDSIYKTLPGTDVWDEDRDALKWPGGAPVVAHPPCGPWGRMRQFANPRTVDLAPWAIDQVRKWGGALEHPAESLIFRHSHCYLNGSVDRWGGWCLLVQQWWWGHPAHKWTRIYVVGCRHEDTPDIPYKIGESEKVIRYSPAVWRDRHKTPITRPEVSKAEREHTPRAFAEWLLEVARRCKRPVLTP
jgi:hypothetical protein